MAEPRREYVSPVREQQAAATRARIVGAGAALARKAPSWDWSGLTFRAIATTSEVSERTVYRYFPTERLLHEAIMRQLEAEAGVTYDDVQLDGFADVAGRVFESLKGFHADEFVRTPPDPAFAHADARRKEALLHALNAEALPLSDRDVNAIAGVLDALWSPTTYERLARDWAMTDPDIVAVLAWTVRQLTTALRSGDSPGIYDEPRK